jgi:hypothetical protein
VSALFFRSNPSPFLQPPSFRPSACKARLSAAASVCFCFFMQQPPPRVGSLCLVASSRVDALSALQQASLAATKRRGTGTGWGGRGRPKESPQQGQQQQPAAGQERRRTGREGRDALRRLLSCLPRSSVVRRGRRAGLPLVGGAATAGQSSRAELSPAAATRLSSTRKGTARRRQMAHTWTHAICLRERAGGAPSVCLSGQHWLAERRGPPGLAGESQPSHPPTGLHCRTDHPERDLNSRFAC